MFNVGKYRLVKYWDADKFELLLTLEGHHADVWCLAISNSGDYIVTGSHDRSIRHWDRTEEPISLRKRKPGGNVAEFQPDIRMLGLSPSHYVLRTLLNVKTNDLEQTLLVSNSASFIFLPSRIVFFSRIKKKAI
ncbi:hypothetical protein Pint_30741 [Pistacia integerrima]|uniref:Uncharacterized protein n=1 Tax=Pistacia integerrima TaxID=434235 RepID=A0ACC0X4I5_9ROSI|nr:hypothetical protein Pint_30741 [Pistacia integerrima]